MPCAGDFREDKDLLQSGGRELLDSSNGANRAQADNLPVAFVFGEDIKGG